MPVRSPEAPSGSGGGGPKDASGGEGFWDKAIDAERAKRRGAGGRGPVPARRRGGVARVVLIVLGVLLALLLALVALAPTIASSLAPGMIRDAAGSAIRGKVSVGSVSLSWFGPQKATHVALADEAGKPIADVSVEAQPGLWSLVTGSRKLGTVRVAGSADIVRAADGTTNLERALASPAGAAPAPAGPGPAPREPFRISEGVGARLVFENIKLTLTDESVAGGPVVVALQGVNGEAVLSAGEPIALKLQTRASSRVSQGPEQTGEVAIDARVDKWAGSDGVLTPARARVDADVRIKDLPTALVDAILGRGGRLAEGLGERVQATVKASGSLEGGEAVIDASAGSPGAAPQLSASVSAKLADDTLTLTAPARVSAKGSAIRALAPQIDEGLAAGGAASIQTFPDAEVTIANLRARVPKDGQTDLRGSSAQVTLKTTELLGALTLGEGQPPRAMRIAPMEATVSVPDLAGPVRVTAQTSATIADAEGAPAPAGSISVDLTASGLLDASGAPRAGLPGGLEGRAQVVGVATALAQPFVAASGLDLPRDLGPAVNLELTARTAPGPGTDPVLDLTLAADAEQLRLDAPLTLSRERVKTGGPGVTAVLRRAGALAGRFVPASSGLAMNPEGSVQVSVPTLDVPLSPKGAPVLDASALEATVSVTGVTLTAAAPGSGPPAALRPAAPVSVSTLRIAPSLGPGRNPKVSLAGSMAQGAEPFSIEGDVELAGLLSPTPAGGEPAALNTTGLAPIGRVVVRGLPTSLAGAVSALAPPAGSSPTPRTYRAGEGLDVPAMLRDAVGPSVDLILAGQGTPENLDVTLDVGARNLSAKLSAKADPEAVSLRSAVMGLTLDPAVTGRIVGTFMGASGGAAPTLAAPASVRFDIEPVTIARTALGDPGRLPVVKLALEAAQPVVVNGLAVGEGAQRRALGPVGISGLKVDVSAPLGTLAAGPNAGTLEATLSGVVVAGLGGAAEERVAGLSGRISAPLSPGPGLADRLSARVTLQDISTAALDRFAAPASGPAGTIAPSELLGPSAGADLALTIDPPAARAGTLGEQIGAGTARVEAQIVSPRVNTSSPIRLTKGPDRLTLDQATTLTVLVEPALAERLLNDPSKPADPATRTSLLAPTTLSLNLERLALALATPEEVRAGATVGPLKPGVFDLALSAAAEPVELSAGRQLVTLAGAQVTARSDRGGPLEVQLNVADASVRASPEAAPQSARGMTLRAGVANLADPSGTPTPERMVIDAQGVLPVVPTALIDALARQDGLLVDALGPVVSATVRAQGLSTGAGTGTLTMEATSDRASAKVQGRLEPGVFRADQAPVQVTVTRIAPELAKRLLQGVPILDTLEKTADQQPATVVGTGLSVPLDNNLRNLSGTVQVDPGTVRFATSRLFGEVLSAVRQRAAGEAGQRLEPLTVEIRQGVATLAPWELPLGEFKIRTEGTVDLVANELDVITWIPLSELSGEMSKLFKTPDLIGNLLGGKDAGADNARDRQVFAPFRSRGPLGNPGPPRPDVKLFLQTEAKKLTGDVKEAPGKILDGLLKDKIRLPGQREPR
jgi:hypothetical protein